MELENVGENICEKLGFSFIKYIDKGQFKEVYLVQDEGKKNLALKIFNSKLCKEREQREIDSILKCAHPNISKVIKFDTVDVNGNNYLYIIEKFLSGGTLRDKIEDNFFSKESIVAFMKDMLLALQHLKELKLVHRDLKPENIMYDGKVPIITDFGLVRDLTQTGLTHSFLASGPGTPYYSSPEQLNNEKSFINWRSDQFALGVVLSIILFDTHPYGKNSIPSGETVLAVENRADFSSVFKSNIDHKLYSIISKMVKPWPYLRYRKPESIINELDSIVL